MPVSRGDNAAGAVKRVEFHRTKYGPELLVDVAWVHDMPAFIVDRPHALAFYDIILVTRGTGTFALDGHTHRVRPGVVLFTTPGQVRDWHVETLDGVCLFFTATFLDEFLNDTTFLARLPFFGTSPDRAVLHLPPRAAARLRLALERMRRELRTLRPDSVHLLRAGLYDALATLGRRYAARHRVAPERPTNPTIDRYRQLIEQRVAQQHTVAEYARELGVTAGHLNALCQRFAGSSAKRMIEDTLAARARRLLLYSADSVARIGATLGFDDPSYFSRFIRRITGRAPSTFRVAQRARRSMALLAQRGALAQRSVSSTARPPRGTP